MGTDLARSLRKILPLPEVILWRYLPDRRFMGLKFRRQFPVGPYVVDFVCLEKKVVIEIDGGQHAEQLIYDNNRTEYLEQFGFNVLRFWNHDVLNRLEMVLEQVRLVVGS